MIIPVRCYTCNEILADKEKYYKRELKRRTIALKKEDSSVNSNKDPLIIDINAPDIKKTIAGEILDELMLFNICCRTKMLTHIDIIDEI